MDTDTHDALMAAILAHPEQDLPRLVYADFLEENDGPTGTCQECNGDGKVHDWTRLDFTGRHPPKWWSAGQWDQLDRVTYCRDCQGSGKGPNRFAERAEFIRLMCDLSSAAVVHRVRELHDRNHRLWFPTGLESSLYTLSSSNPSHVITRGFISEVRCRIDWWTGGTCNVCDGESRREVDSTDMYGHRPLDHIICGRCDGVGTTVANGPVVVKSHPVTRVTLTDHRPLHINHSSSDEFQWHRQNEDSEWLENNSVLPADVFKFLTGGKLIGYWLRYYETERQAVDDLSIALLCSARQITVPE